MEKKKIRKIKSLFKVSVGAVFNLLRCFIYCDISNFITSLPSSNFIGTLKYYLNHSQELVGQRAVVTTWMVDWQDSDVFVH